MAVIGAGQSALEAAALLHEHGANVRLLARTKNLSWNADPVVGARPLKARLLCPPSGLGDGMSLRLYGHHPLLTHALPEHTRCQVAYTALGPAGAYWLRPRFEDRVDARLGRAVAGTAVEDGRVRLELQGADGTEQLVVDRVVAGTGYRAELKRLPFLDDPLRSRVVSVNGAPVLDRSFESSVRNLYFAGYLAGLSFGPVMRFVFGTEFTAERVSGRLARRVRREAGA